MHTLRQASPHVRGWYRHSPGPETAAVFDGGPATPARARAFTRAVLARWGLQPVCEDACLIVSELATNAVRESDAAGQPGVLVRLRRARRCLLIEAGDHNPGPPPRVIAMPQNPVVCHGRGLAIVLQLANRTGWYRLGPWKVMWAALEALATHDPAPPAAPCRQRGSAA